MLRWRTPSAAGREFKETGLLGKMSRADCLEFVSPLSEKSVRTEIGSFPASKVLSFRDFHRQGLWDSCDESVIRNSTRCVSKSYTGDCFSNSD
jgi:hypothetical protein